MRRNNFKIIIFTIFTLVVLSGFKFFLSSGAEAFL